MNTSCLILAAGKGKRFGQEKMYATWKGIQLWQRAYSCAKDVLDGGVYIVGLDVEGGSTRQESVKNGLTLVDTNRVIIHEVSRPLITPEHYKMLLKHNYPSVTYATLNDTPLYNHASHQYSQPEETMTIQNLQIFDTKLLKEAHNRTSIRNAADDTVIMKDVHNIDPKIIPIVDRTLFKVIYREDLYILDAIAA